MANNDGDKRVLATAQHIVRTLGKNEHMTEDMIRILSNFDDRFSNMNELTKEPRGPPASSVSAIIQKMGERLNVAEEVIMRRTSDVRLIWDGHPDDAVVYLRAVDDLQSLMGPLSSPWSDKAMLDRAHHVLQVAAQRLIEEFNVMLVTNSEAVDTEWLSYCENEPSAHSARGGEDPHAPVSDSSDDDEDEDIPLAHPVTDFNAVFDPIPPERVKDLNEIAQRIVRAGYGRECIQVYVNVRKSVLEQSLYRLGMQKIKMEIVQKMAWEGLEAKIKNWIQALKVAAKVVFPTEKKLCDNVFVGLNPQRANSFPELASGALMQFLAFGKAVAGVRRTPEKLFKILDMFEIIKDLRSDINMVFCDELCERIRTEVGIVLGQLGEAARGTLQEFELAIQKDASKIPVVGGAFHPLTRYVMNYIKFLVDYSGTLEILLKDKRREVPKSLGVETFGLSETLLESRSRDNEQVSSLAVQIMWLIVYLEGNLDAKSKLYMDQSMALLFLMNNVHYIVQKVRQSELSALLGDGWLRKHNGQVRVYAANYVRTAWKTVFSCLRDEGLTTNGRLSSGVSRVAIKDRFKNFNLAFEEACAAQSSFVVPDPQLREELRIAIAEKLIPAYRSFVGRYGNFLETGRQPDKYLKYSPDDLENHVIDLFDAPN
ncbi:hypothetical protein KP509_22G036600 [Ceratopteris richardii]|uniref:Exocyst subunit Exo70 family protein n=1 Tax=Ceratopteris richardii TaxID=49495 RepID=A0A8T2S619_CERRI|nr:hypothetical protein KP509_22G036600 [Ceratopteris richardii]